MKTVLLFFPSPVKCLMPSKQRSCMLFAIPSYMQIQRVGRKTSMHVIWFSFSQNVSLRTDVLSSFMQLAAVYFGTNSSFFFFYLFLYYRKLDTWFLISPDQLIKKPFRYLVMLINYHFEK